MKSRSATHARACGDLAWTAAIRKFKVLATVVCGHELPSVMSKSVPLAANATACGVPAPAIPGGFDRSSQAKDNSVVIGIAASMERATGHREAWNSCARSAASRLSSGHPLSV